MTDKKFARRTLIKAYGIRFVIMVDAQVRLFERKIYKGKTDSVWLVHQFLSIVGWKIQHRTSGFLYIYATLVLA